MEITPITFAEAAAFVERVHRTHERPPAGHKFSVAVSEGGQVRGVAIVGRPVARGFDDGWTLEVTRCCTDGTPNACSKLYATAWRAARALGYRRLITYTLETEPGTSLTAAGWTILHRTKGGSWNCETRPRVDRHPLQRKLCWEAPK